MWTQNLTIWLYGTLSSCINQHKKCENTHSTNIWMRVGVSSHPEFFNNKFQFFGQKNWIYEAEDEPNRFKHSAPNEKQNFRIFKIKIRFLINLFRFFHEENAKFSTLGSGVSIENIQV